MSRMLSKSRGIRKNVFVLLVIALLSAIPTSHGFVSLGMMVTSSNVHQRLSSSLASMPTQKSSPLPSRGFAPVVSPAIPVLDTLKSAFRFVLSPVLWSWEDKDTEPEPQVQVIKDIAGFPSLIESYDEPLVAVFFHSPYCKACQAAAPHFERLSTKFSNDVKFVSVPLTKENKADLIRMGVEKFPFGRIYDASGAKLLDELPMLRKLVPQFEQRLNRRVRGDRSPQLLEQ